MLSMEILVLSDLHLEFGTFVVPENINYDVVILAGDIAVPGVKAVHWAARESTFGRASDVLLLAGNHEFYGQCIQPELTAMKRASDHRVHVLDGDEVVIRGVRFLGCTLWTDFGLRIQTPEGWVSDPAKAMHACRQVMNDYAQIRTQVYEDQDGALRPPLKPEHTLEFHRQQRAWLETKLAEPFDGPTVVITHHAPHRNSVAEEYESDWVSAAYASELPAHFFNVPVLWVHGHTHVSLDYLVGNCRVFCNPRGYMEGYPKAMPENASFNPGLVIDIEGAL